MLLEFRVKNYRSYKNEQVLSFEASSDKTLEDYYCVTIKPNLRVLKVGIIYGANASGKTNILRALNFLRSLVLSPKERDKKTGFIPFLFDESSRKNSGIFQITFLIEKIKYFYSLELNENKILHEKLIYYPGIQPAKIFERRIDELKKKKFIFEIGKKVKLKTSDKNVLEGNTLENMTIISALTKTNIIFVELEKVYNWFKYHLDQMITPKTDIRRWTLNLFENRQIKSKMLNLISNADFNISDLDIEQEEIELDEEAINRLKLSKAARKKLLSIGRIELRKIFFKHKVSGKIFSFPENYESAGTLRYFGLGGPLLYSFQNDKVLIIDEIENSLHPDLIIHFLNTFLLNSKYSQLLFTTHNLIFLQEQDNIRRDIIWFTEKKQDGSTELYSLADFRIRKSMSYLNAYRAGKFGAIPKLGNTNLEDE